MRLVLDVAGTKGARLAHRARLDTEMIVQKCALVNDARSLHGRRLSEIAASDRSNLGREVTKEKAGARYWIRVARL
jgi:hypothetical protein